MSDHKTETTTRRTFVQMTAAGLGAVALHRPAAAAPAASDRIRVGFIGLGGQGTGRLRGFMAHPDVEAVAVCDVDQNHLNRAVELVQKTQNHKPDAYRDFRRVLDRKDIDAVMIGTPDHWHAIPHVMACQAGKDVFVEKPLSYSIGEGRAMARAAESHQRITQMGNHIHNDLPNYRRVVEIIQAGKLGTIHRVDCSLRTGVSPIGHPADCPPPPELDYEFWLGPAPKRPYNPNRSHFNYRYFWDYSGGMFIDFWCHYTDLVYWALKLDAPLSVSATGGRWSNDDNGETPDTFDALYEYPNKLTLTWMVNPYGRPGFDHMGSSVIFEGSEATLVANYSRYEVYVKGKKEDQFQPPPQTIPDSPGHIREFLDSIKSRKLTTCNVSYGHKLNKGGLLANIALRTGERIHWDDQRERITGHTKANRYVMRKYRKPWKLA